jgi:hypothetical protein
MPLRHLPETHRRELLTFVQSYARDCGTTPESAQTPLLAADVLRVVRLPRELNELLLDLAAQANSSPDRIITDALREFMRPAR